MIKGVDIDTKVVKYRYKAVKSSSLNESNWGLGTGANSQNPARTVAALGSTVQFDLR